MEELRQVALAYYDNCNPDLRGRAWEFFQSMDADGDQRISQREFKEFLRQSGYDTIITDPDFFAKLDRNGDRGLDFQEVLTFYYIIKTGYIFCRGCGIYLSGFYFTCFECFRGSHPFTFDLCHDCHRSPRFTHHHPLFLDNRILLYYKRGPDNNMAMGDLYEAAIAYYNNPATPEVRSCAVSFFRSLATNGACQISYVVFNEFLQQTGYNWIINDPKLFEKLDRNCDGSLDFWELLTFYYIINTRYFHCRQCRGYLSGLYFTCVDCFEEGAHHSHRYDPGTYNLCLACYRYRVFSHHHSNFLDNHILLRSKRYHPHAAPHLNKWQSYFDLLDVAINAVALAANCSIM
ncbi:hypothetical protein M0R45_018567 [Rubus argutus]|uniref:EF-hand domain-containing protein n=1 Tax=Rubus argutus TaxID=59490 RepID=A0AAW1X3U6_RUBAR